MMLDLRAVAIAATISFFAICAQAQESVHKLAIHVDENDPSIMNLALNNAQNVMKYYQSKGEKVAIEIVAYGPGLNMYVAGESPVKDRISALSLESGDIVFSACENTRQGMIKKTGKDVALLSEATSVPSGVVRLMELQGEGYAYVKP